MAVGIVYDVACFGRSAEAWALRNGKPEWIGLIVLREAPNFCRLPPKTTTPTSGTPCARVGLNGKIATR